MFLATAVVSALLAAALVASALLKLSHRPTAVERYARLGVPEDRLNHLAALLLAGAVGLVVGLFWVPIGIIAAICLILFFFGAMGFHIRVSDFRGLPVPAALCVLAAVALALRLAST
ncbi:DoxX family protein [Streptomyces apocyni]|uniref:DoxX family protein n=1 Tax=Streptomyces apocyni TaxID=2654677 RepID=UPI0012EAA17B|nr:DoxX family protein [Streptomyces apocyni]